MGSAARRCWDGYLAAVGTVVSALSACAGCLGGTVSRRPKTVSFVMLLLVGCASLGWLRFQTQNQADRLWVPQTGRAQDARSYVDQYSFDCTAGEAAQMLVTLKPDYTNAFNGNVNQMPVAWEMFRVHDAVIGIQTTWQNRTYSYADICFRTIGRRCAFSGYLQYWNSSFTNYLATVDGLPFDPLAGNFSEFDASVNALTFPDGSAVVPLSIFGGLQYNWKTLHIDSAMFLSFSWPIDPHAPTGLAAAWYNDFISLLEAMAPQMTYSQLAYQAGTYSFQVEAEAAIKSDLPLIGISLGLFVLVTVAAFSRWDWVHTRTSLAVAGVAFVTLGMAAGFGLSLATGTPFTQLSETLPFILLAIGIDIMFILNKGMDEIDAGAADELTPTQRFTRLMETAGLSSIIVGLTNIVAFGLGAITELPAIRWFSIFATINVACVLVVQLTLFLAAFVLNERRIAARRADLACCCTVPELPAGKGLDSRKAAVKGGLVRRGIESYYAPWLMHPFTKVLVLLVFAVLAGLSIFGITRINEGQPLQDVIADSSYLKPFLEAQTDYYDTQIGDSTSMYFRNIDQADPVEQAKMLQALTTVLENPFINTTMSGYSGNWLLSFIAYVQEVHPNVTLVPGCGNPYVGRVQGPLAQLIQPVDVTGCVPQKAFYPLLKEFLATGTYMQFANSIAFSPAGAIVTSCLDLVHVASDDMGKYDRHAYNSVLATEDNINAHIFAVENAATPGSTAFFMYEPNYIFWAGDAVLPYTALEYSIMAVVGVGLVMLVLLVHPLATLIMAGAVALVTLLLYGEMWLLGIRLNNVSMVNMVLATGLAVDYTIYFAQKFMATAGDDRSARVCYALTETGGAIFLGGFTALAGSVPLAFAKSTLLRTFFALLFGTILCSLLVGLVLLPVVFSLIGPRRTIKYASGDVEPTLQPRSSFSTAADAVTPTKKSQQRGGHRPGRGGLDSSHPSPDWGKNGSKQNLKADAGSGSDAGDAGTDSEMAVKRNLDGHFCSAADQRRWALSAPSVEASESSCATVAPMLQHTVRSSSAMSM